jgi:DNA repair exonuclease SbcCD ATPase subunit
VEGEIAALEARVAEVERRLAEASAAADVEQINALAAEYEQQRARLEDLYGEWEALAS